MEHGVSLYSVSREVIVVCNLGLFLVFVAGWYSYYYWIAGFLATFTLFISVLIHELAHSLVARSRGLAVSSITLFILGGVSNLAEEPEKQGKALLGELAGFRSIRAVGQRYRIIYQIKGNNIVVVIVAVGIRRDGAKDDIYNLAKKLFRLRLLSELKQFMANFTFRDLS